ncbi:hypothetical protein L3Q82_003432 [Scortum barcoo]|uniref:Uncharacterized protein n=1 Tax=Scortum barcoo TaxID=214431 RepID=A0ACB8VMX3_9TELE|nr:hypothetical protein L3Q82_003432 [Scortum barcoo]
MKWMLLNNVSCITQFGIHVDVDSFKCQDLARIMEENIKDTCPQPSNSQTPNSTMAKTKELSKDTRNKIVDLHQAGKTESAIGVAKTDVVLEEQNDSRQERNSPAVEVQKAQEDHCPSVITRAEVCRTFKWINTHKAPGPDGIPGRALKDFVTWCDSNHLLLNTTKTRENGGGL